MFMYDRRCELFKVRNFNIKILLFPVCIVLMEIYKKKHNDESLYGILLSIQKQYQKIKLLILNFRG